MGMFDGLLDLFGSDANFFGGKTADTRARGAGQIAWESVPFVSEAVTYRDIKRELAKKDPNWWAIGLLGGAGALGLVPIVGDIAGNFIRQGVKVNKLAKNPEISKAEKIKALRKEANKNRFGEDFDKEIGGNEGWAEYLKKTNQNEPRIESRPNFGMGDFYGMLPKNATKIKTLDDVTYYKSKEGDYYATANNPDLNEEDVVGYVVGKEKYTDLHVVSEMQNKGIGGELQYLFRKDNPNAPTGGLTLEGEKLLEKTYQRLKKEGILDKKILNPAQQQSKKIIDLLKSGKADEVTDYMMARADQKYLYDNYDLPMDYKSRMLRAKEMGLTEDAFHGTDVDFEGFSPNKPVFMSDAPEVADTYTNKLRNNVTDPTGMILPLKVPKPNKNLPYLEISGEGQPWSDLRGSTMTYDPIYGENELDTIMSLRNKDLADSQLGFGYRTKEITSTENNPIDVNTGFRTKADNVGVIFDNILDRGGGGYTHLNKTSKHNEPSRVRAEFDPKNIRSKFARFDPRLKHLKNLSAGIALGLLPFIRTNYDEEQDSYNGLLK